MRRGRRVGRVAGWLITVVLASCSGPRTPDPEGPPPLPTNFTPGPPVGEPDPIAGDELGGDYLATLAESLQPRWASFLDDLRLRLPPKHELNDRSLSTELELVIDSSGVLLGLEVVRPSGARDLDQAASEVVRDAQPFARPPAELASDDGKFRFRWLFARDRRQAGPATASVHLERWPLSEAVPKLLAAERIDDALRRLVASESSAAPYLEMVALDVIERGLAARELEAVRAAGDRRFATALAGIADGARSVQLRRAAIAALGRADPESSKLAVLAQSDKPAVARAAASALVGRGDIDAARANITGRLERPERRPAALVVLAEVPAPAALSRLVGLVRGARGNVRLLAIEALGVTARDPQATGTARLTLTRLLKNRDRKVRAAACSALASSADGPAIIRRRVSYWAVVELLRSRDQVVRGACALAAARLAPRLFANELARLRNADSRPVQLGLARGLGDVPGNAALERLLALASSSDTEVRAIAASSLARRSEPEAGRAHRKLLSDGEARVRIAALRDISDPATLRAALGDASAEVRALALRKLVSEKGHSGLATDTARSMLEAGPVERLRLAGAWLEASERAASR